MNWEAISAIGRIVGALALVISLIYVTSEVRSIPYLIRGPLLVLLGVLMCYWGAFLAWRRRQYAAKADAKSIVTDSKPRVLYLRAFRSDASTRRFVFSTAFAVWPSATLEEELAEVLRPFGGLLAVGQPGEGLPKPGAARIYASDEEWKEVVSCQLRAARLVIIRAGVGENLLWEAQQAVEILNPKKVLIFVFRMKAKHYESFRTKVTQILGLSLPEKAILRPHFGRVSGFISFATEWKPTVSSLPRYPYLYFRTSPFKSRLPYLKLALRPVFESFGLEWRPPPLQGIPMILALGIVTLLLAVLLNR